MKATIKTLGEYHGAGVYRLEVKSQSHYDFGCDDYEDPIDIQKMIGDARRSLHNELDIAIDAATADFLKSKLKKID